MKIPHKKKIAMIGLGQIAQKAYLPIVANHSKISPILCTRNLTTLNQIADQFRINEKYSDLEKLIHSQPDAAMVHSSTESHFETVSKLLNARIPVFVDKPLCYTLKETETLLNLATQKQTLIYLGFNRRFAPLIQNLKKQGNPNQVFYQKNRTNLPGDPRVFVFDDFIHVVDSLRFLAEGKVEKLKVLFQGKNKKLEFLQVHWQQNDSFLNGRMNRINGITEEQIEFYTPDNKLVINELNTGTHFQNGKSMPLGFGNWESTLYKRGFVNMIDDWLEALEENTFDANRIQDIWETHHLCESIVNKINVS